MSDATASEAAVLAYCIEHPGDAQRVLDLVPPAAYYGTGHPTLAGVLVAMLEQKLPVDPSTVLARLVGRDAERHMFWPNAGAWLNQLLQHLPAAASNADWHAEQVLTMYVDRQLQAESQRVADALREGSTDTDTAAAVLTAAVDRAQSARSALAGIAVRTAADLLSTDPPMRWRMPGLIGWREKIIWTGLDGLGKTELAAQLAVCAAAGYQPFTGEVFEPVRVLVVDLENELDALRRRYRRIVGAVELLHELDRSMLMVEVLEAGMDITRPDDYSKLRRLVAAARADILLIGPLSKMARGKDLNKEENAVQLCSRLDELRVEHDLATLTEAHPSKEKGGDGQRMPAPRGSSYFLGWPSIGFGMRPHPDQREEERPSLIELKRFRGNREDRDWPPVLERYDGVPGFPAMPFGPVWGSRERRPIRAVM